MKSAYLFALFSSVALLVIGTACERHPASQTIPGYKEQDLQKEHAHEKKIMPASQAPTFFQSQKNSR